MTYGRFEKLKKMEFSWFMNVLKDSFPAIDEKLQILTDVAHNLQVTGQVGNNADFTEEEERRWGEKGLTDVSLTRQRDFVQRRERSQAVTVNGPRALGMLGIRGTHH